jgi:hypothetical protein
MDDVQKSYFENSGVFLVTVGGGKMVETGAFHWKELGHHQVQPVRQRLEPAQ